MQAEDVHRAWSLYYSEEGYPYFYNHVTNESYWAELPKSQSLATGVEADDSWKTYDAADSLVNGIKNDSSASSSSSDSSSISSSSSSSESSSSNSSSDKDSDSGSDIEKENKRDFKAYLESTEGLDVVNDIETHKGRIEELKLKARQARISHLKKRKKRRNRRANKDNKDNNHGIFTVISEYFQYFQGYISKVPNSANMPLEIENGVASNTTAIAENETKEIENETNNKETVITPIFQRCVPEVVTTTLINNIIPAAIPVYTSVTSTIQSASNLLMKKAMESVTVIGCALWQSIEPTIVKLVENPEVRTEEVEEEVSPTEVATESIPAVVAPLDFSKLPPAPPPPPTRPPPIRSAISDDKIKPDNVDKIVGGLMQEVVANVITINSS